MQIRLQEKMSLRLRKSSLFDNLGRGFTVGNTMKATSLGDFRIAIQDTITDYTLKSDDEIIDAIALFGCGEIEFHTCDIARIMAEKQWLEKQLAERDAKIEELSEAGANCLMEVMSLKMGSRR